VADPVSEVDPLVIAQTLYSGFEALGVRQLLGAPTTMSVLVGASPTGPTSEWATGCRESQRWQYGEGAQSTLRTGVILAGHCYYRSKRGTKILPLVTGGNSFPARLVKKKRGMSKATLEVLNRLSHSG
jgi:hypothetical protein